MPLTSKGRKVMSSLRDEYGEDKGEEVFYKMRSSGKLTGVDAASTLRRVGDALRAGGSPRTAVMAGASASSAARTVDAVRTALAAGKPARDALRAAARDNMVVFKPDGKISVGDDWSPEAREAAAKARKANAAKHEKAAVHHEERQKATMGTPANRHHSTMHRLHREIAAAHLRGNANAVTEYTNRTKRYARRHGVEYMPK